MSLYIRPHDALAITALGQRWARQCLIEDGSVLSQSNLSTVRNLDELDRYFVQRPDTGAGSFYDKLMVQLEPANPQAKQLMAELLWGLFLFPSNLNAETKRAGVRTVWAWSGDVLPGDHPLLSDAALEGIGSGGMGVNTNRWRELIYIIGLVRAAKAQLPQERERIFTDYERFIEWIATTPMDGNRQFRHMLRYMLFPQRVERMSSNRDRQRVLAGFGVADTRTTARWSDRQLDDALWELRSELQVRYGTDELDFYLDPLRDQWKSPNDAEVVPDDDESVDDPVMRADEPVRPSAARNLILYGPPGTGKTWRLQQLFDKYTDQPADVDRQTWELQLVADHGWRTIIAAALADQAQPVRVATLETHGLIKAKSSERSRDGGVRATLWGFLQAHTPLDVSTVNTSGRRPPYIFTKDEASAWSLVEDWQELEPEAAQLLNDWRRGPDQQTSPVKRYRLVTLHPSYSYEDFVIGLRPSVPRDDMESSAAGFRLARGVFMQLCDEARRTPSRRHALFIDEINRANIAKVFGELITLIEPDKRAHYDASGRLVKGIEVQLPGTGSDDASPELFGVPDNLDIYGTMNTADRSTTVLDVALRRRFEFEEMSPDYGVIQHRVEGVDLASLLKVINDRLEVLMDREHRIGHAYFVRIGSLDDLREVFRKKVIPLLQEYFFDDWRRIAQVLCNPTGRSPFIAETHFNGAELFAGRTDVDVSECIRYQVTAATEWQAADFVSLYESRRDNG